MKNSKIVGYTAGIISGAAYGLNPLFAKALLKNGIGVLNMLFFRYILAVLFLAIYIAVSKEIFKINLKQSFYLLILGLLYTGSSYFLFDAYNHIPSGLATTLIYLYPVFTALIMVLLRQYPSRQVWLCVISTIIGVVFLCLPSGNIKLNPTGIIESILSGLCFAIYLVLVNKAKTLKKLSSNVITFYSLAIGAFLFIVYMLILKESLVLSVNNSFIWFNLIGLAIIPTIISLVCLALASKLIGPTKTAVLGVFEPMTAILIGCMYFNESLSKNIIIGLIICVSAVIFMILSNKTKERE